MLHCSSGSLHVDPDLTLVKTFAQREPRRRCYVRRVGLEWSAAEDISSKAQRQNEDSGSSGARIYDIFNKTPKESRANVVGPVVRIAKLL